jgi:hypothetical protein
MREEEEVNVSGDIVGWNCMERGRVLLELEQDM